MLVAAIDPGLMTGAALVRFDTPEGCTLETSTELEFGRVMLWCETFLPMADRVVVEKFLITKKTISNSQAPWSLETQGVVRAVSLRIRDQDVELQTPAEAKSLVDNKMIRRLGLWHRGGEGHARDAIRHAITYAIRKGWRDPRMMPTDA